MPTLPNLTGHFNVTSEERLDYKTMVLFFFIKILNIGIYQLNNYISFFICVQYQIRMMDF